MFSNYSVIVRCNSSDARYETVSTTKVSGKDYPTDEWTNVTPTILQKVGANLHRKSDHPIGLIRSRIQNFFYKTFTKRGNPLFSVYDDLNPVVTLTQNFDNLLVPPDHVSRSRSDSYYINATHMLRAHTTAHQKDLITSGLNNFLMVGDVYRRDTVDSSHYPVFHQLDGVRLFSRHEVVSLFCSVTYPLSFLKITDKYCSNKVFKLTLHLYAKHISYYQTCFK